MVVGKGGAGGPRSAWQRRSARRPSCSSRLDSRAAVHSSSCEDGEVHGGDVRATSRPYLVQVSFSPRPYLPHISSMSRPHPRVLSAYIPISPHISPHLPHISPHLPISPSARSPAPLSNDQTHTHYYYGGRSAHARLVAVAVRKDGGQVVCGGVPGVWANRPRRARRGEVQANLHGELHGEMHHRGGSTVRAEFSEHHT